MHWLIIIIFKYYFLWPQLCYLQRDNVTYVYSTYFDKLKKFVFDVLLSMFQTEAYQVIPKTPGAISKMNVISWKSYDDLTHLTPFARILFYLNKPVRGISVLIAYSS